VPQTLSYIQVLFPEHKERTKAIGWFGITLGLASILGQFLGGFFSYYHFAIEGWRLIFFINLPIGIIAILSAARYLKETPADNSKKFDRPGVLLLTLALVSLIVPLIQGREYHWPAWSIVLLLLSGLLFYWFYRDQVKKGRKGDSPLINIQLFGNKDFNIGLLTVLCLFCIHNSYLLISTLFLQNGLQLNAFVTGNSFVILGITFMISSLLSIRLVVRFGKLVVQVGVLIMILSFLLQLHVFTRSIPEYWQICCLLGMHGLGTGLVMPSLLNITLKSVPLHFAGAASGLYSTVQQSASALGVTLIGGLFFDMLGRAGGYDHYAAAFRYSTYAEIVVLVMMSILLAVLPNNVRVSRGSMALAE
jgi:MFS family permease